MKTIILFRHGKSDWNADFDHDHERPIGKRGRKAARAMGRFLTEVDQQADRIVTSSAVRARQTLEQAQEAGAWTAPVRVTDALYDASPDDVMEEIWAAPDATACLLLVGHEPTWSLMTGRLIGGGQVRFPTAAMARIDVEVERWNGVSFGSGTLMWFLPPKLIS